MTHRVLLCETCGAPLEAPWEQLVIVCAACGSHNVPGRGVVPAYVPADGRPRLNLGGRTWVVEGRLATGDSSVVYRARWVSRLGEAVVLKVQANASDADLLRGEWDTLSALQRTVLPGAVHFLGRLPRPVATGLVETDRPRVAAVYGWKSGFVHTLTEIGDHHPAGIPGQAMVWLGKRLFELLGYVHRAGWVHGAVTPDHILVHPRDHGATLVGWTSATPWAGRPGLLRARPGRWLSLYEGHAAGATPALDLSMACRCVLAAGAWHLPGAARHRAVDAVLTRGAAGHESDGWALAEALTAASREAYGPPAWHPLTMPGWGT